jgi:uncharacterized membrane protein YagU involved in acid resistance
MSARILAGIVGSVVAGLVLGVMMQAGGRMAMLGSMLGVESAGLGWVIHLVMSVVFGVVYGLALMAISTRLGANLGLGLAYGAVIWVLGPLMVMPMMMGGAVLAVDQEALMSLVGHVIWGALTGALAVAVHRRLPVSRRQYA